MMFGRELRLPVDVELMSQQSSSDTLSKPTEVTAIVDQQLKVHKTLAHKASANIQDAQTQQKEYYDHQP